MLSFHVKGLSNRPILKYGLLVITACIISVTLTKLPDWFNSYSPTPEKEILVRHFLSHSSKVASHYQQNQTTPSVSIPN
ncbi:hypothetical protein [Planktothrix agardhii]|uniref:Uncharacterized protein n=1 Tax=Planktothrix agardhii TaxID=1160 RepID=A0A1J1JPP4_PLAAG|nr:hypothetical protein [Planktothrix agardhii]MCF3619912.1 hypothetical protein [Planktothrix agardhii 1030]MEA5560728.1 hypothetical protein [Planktothrix agardhii UHCC 0887]MCB8760740.1 hypothetical protein [Planktothrix agardhii 1813]MCB8763448.1 hypothetical protein [Planktothrix agardhii 1809]MCB8777102.1 hypothetical protein [Planktothrix agardhii 1031]